MQTALNIMQKLCNKEGLKVNQGKTNIVAFTKGRTKLKLKKPTLFVTELKVDNAIGKA